MPFYFLFHPFDPKKIPFLKVSIQGIVPASREKVALFLAERIFRELRDIPALLGEAQGNQVMDTVAGSLANRLRQEVDRRIPSFIPLQFKVRFLDILEGKFREELPSFLLRNLPLLMGGIPFSLVLKLVEEKIYSLNLVELEREILTRFRQEFFLLTLVGGMVGLIPVFFAFLMLRLFYGISFP